MVDGPDLGGEGRMGVNDSGYGPTRYHFDGASLPSLVRAACKTTPADQVMTWAELWRRLLRVAR